VGCYLTLLRGFASIMALLTIVASPARPVAAADSENGQPTNGAGVWSPIPATSLLDVRAGALAMWTGNEVLIWGGNSGSPSGDNDGARFNPATDTWGPMATVGAPSGRSAAAVTWTGRELFVWGGSRYGRTLGDGAMYAPPASATAPSLPVALPRSGGGGGVRRSAAAPDPALP